MEKQIQEITHAEPISVEVQRAKDGTYYWTIKSHAKNITEALDDIYRADADLKDHFIPVSPSDFRAEVKA